MSDRINVSNVDWNGKDGWKSLIKFIKETPSDLLSTTTNDGSTIIVTIQQNVGVRRADWYRGQAIIVDYDLLDNGTITKIETFEHDNEYQESCAMCQQSVQGRLPKVSVLNSNNYLCAACSIKELKNLIH